MDAATCILRNVRKSGGLEEQGLGSEREVDREHLMCGIMWADALWIMGKSKMELQRMRRGAEKRRSPGRRWNQSKNHRGQTHIAKKQKAQWLLKGLGSVALNLG